MGLQEYVKRNFKKTKVGELMMPYLKDLPMSLNRFPGIHGQSFYQKNVTDKAPDWPGLSTISPMKERSPNT